VDRLRCGGDTHELCNGCFEYRARAIFTAASEAEHAGRHQDGVWPRMTFSVVLLTNVGLSDAQPASDAERRSGFRRDEKVEGSAHDAARCQRASGSRRLLTGARRANRSAS
jgi:hypothetical protein